MGAISEVGEDARPAPGPDGHRSHPVVPCWPPIASTVGAVPPPPAAGVRMLERIIPVPENRSIM
ncbi:hypothetical protein GCM10010244_60070 [Streptomyces coeruleorubidus]|nr:hypothetical protein GCM10010244_60070 [Streptomyces bellus]